MKGWDRCDGKLGRMADLFWVATVTVKPPGLFKNQAKEESGVCEGTLQWPRSLVDVDGRRRHENQTKEESGV